MTCMPRRTACYSLRSLVVLHIDASRVRPTRLNRRIRRQGQALNASLNPVQAVFNVKTQINAALQPIDLTSILLLDFDCFQIQV